MMDYELDMDELLEQKIWVDEDDCYIPIDDIPTRQVYAIERKLRKAVDSGASDYVRRWYAVFVEEAAIRRGMTQPD